MGIEANTNTSADKQGGKPVLIVGGAGKTGGRLAERLERAGLPYRYGSRSAAPAFDWADEAGWPAALEGAGAAYVTYYPDLAAPGAVDKIRAFSKAALEKGVRRIVLLSGRGEEEAQAAEQALVASGADWTILRCSWFSQNFSESYFCDGVLAGDVALPAGDVPEPFVDCDDIADAAFAALTEEGHVGRLYELTGPRAMTFAEAVAEIAEALGRPVAFTRVPLDDYAAALRAEDVPDEVVSLVVFLFGTVLDGRNSTPQDGVSQVLGRPAKDFRDYAREVAARGVWDRA